MEKSEFEKIVKACRFCLMCRHLCTVGNITYAETNTPRGQALMLDCMGSEALENNTENRKRAAEVLFSCCYCGHCLNNCVSSYNHPDAVIKARADISEEDLPENVLMLRSLVEKNGGIFEKGTRIEGKTDKMGTDVLLYIGSYIRNEAPEIAQAAIEILDKADVDYTMLSQETGTGMDAYLLGMPDFAQKQLDREIQKIKALKPLLLVILSPEDKRVFSNFVPGLNASVLDPEDFDMDTFHIPAWTFSGFVQGLLKSGKLELKGSENMAVSYHDGDQGGRFLNDFEAPREVLGAVPGIEYHELFWSMGEAASAGESGAVRVLDRKLAGEIARKRMEQIKDRGIDVLVTDSAEAKAQLAPPAGEDIQIVHIAEFIYKHL